jgi:hypothetical protein
VQFRIESELEPIQVCHCSQYRKAHGTPFGDGLQQFPGTYVPPKKSEA